MIHSLNGQGDGPESIADSRAIVKRHGVIRKFRIWVSNKTGKFSEIHSKSTNAKASIYMC